MKKRQGFVSNSSSSSYIIAIPGDMDKKCPTCNRKLLTLIDKLRAGPRWGYSGDETSIILDGRINTLEHYQEERDNAISRTKKALLHSPNEICHGKGSWKVTWEKEKQYAEEERDYNQNLIDKINETEGYIAKIQISYHDHEISDEFEALRKNGEIVIIESWC